MKIGNVSSLLKLYDKRNPVYKRKSPYFQRCNVCLKVQIYIRGDMG